MALRLVFNALMTIATLFAQVQWPASPPKVAAVWAEFSLRTDLTDCINLWSRVSVAAEHLTKDQPLDTWPGRAISRFCTASRPSTTTWATPVTSSSMCSPNGRDDLLARA